MPLSIHFNIFLYLISGLVFCFNGDEHLEIQSLKSQQVGAVPGNSELWHAIQQNPGAVTFQTMIHPNQTIQLSLTGKLNLTSEAYTLNSLNVTFSDGRKQTISLRDIPVIWSKNEIYPFLKLADFNFDGFADLQVFDNAGATGNFWYQSWFHMQKGFVYTRSLSEIPSPKIDTGQKQILSYIRSGACQETVGYYTVKANKLSPIRYVYSEESRCGNQPCCVVYKKHLSGKKWETVKLGSGDVYHEYYKR